MGIAVSADPLGGVYISGDTAGSLAATSTNAGSYDAFVSKLDNAGSIQWTAQIGTSTNDGSRGVSADGLGNVYVSGVTRGNLDGPNTGGNDAFVSRLDATGNVLWTRQLGTTALDESWAIAADGLGNAYISGVTTGNLDGLNAGGRDAFVSKYNDAGNLLWTRQLGTSSDDQVWAISADGAGNVYVTGHTEGSLDGPHAGDRDVFVRKYDSAGNVQWARQLGTSTTETGHGISADPLGNIYVAGSTFGSLAGPSAGSYDAFLIKYNQDGDIQWTRQLGTSSLDYGNGVSIDGQGNVYLSGHTFGSLGGPQAGWGDPYVSKYDSDGNIQWIRQFGTNSEEITRGVATDGLGNVYMAGQTEGSMGAPNVGGVDAFLSKIVDPIDPNGDFDEDGTVDGNDFLVWQRGESPAGITFADLVQWEATFGTEASPGQIAIAEPTSAALVLASALCWLGLRYRIRATVKLATEM